MGNGEGVRMRWRSSRLNSVSPGLWSKPFAGEAGCNLTAARPKEVLPGMGALLSAARRVTTPPRGSE